LRVLHRPLAERVSNGLRNAILDGQLSPGDRIRQEAVARDYGTSRIPVREALRQLESEGLVTLEPHVGARVARLERDELDEVYLLRERLESLAIAQSAPHLSESQLADLRRLVEEMERAAASDDLTRWIELDRRFHLATFAGASLPRLLRLIEGFWNTTQQYRRAYTLLPRRLDIAHLEHRLLLEALERRDPSDAERLLQTHIRRTRLTLDEHLELFDI
jgi:DNA-binding GntR family transcriptional regulator